MTSFLNPQQAIKRIWDEVAAIKARLNAISTGAGQVRSPSGGTGQVGVLPTHPHDGTGTGGDLWTKGTDRPSAVTLAVGVAGHYFHVTGTTTITAIATRPAGTELILEFDGALTITHGASLILANATNITTVAGDVIRFTSEGGGTWRQSTAKQTASAVGAPANAQYLVLATDPTLAQERRFLPGAGLAAADGGAGGDYTLSVSPFEFYIPFGPFTESVGP